MGREHTYWLNNRNQIGRIKIFRLLEQFQTPERIYQSSETELRESKILSERDIVEMVVSKRTWNLEKEYDKLQKSEVKMTVFGEKDYPKRLHNIPDPPYCLYYIGSLPKEEEKALAIIGARNCSEYGRYMAREFAVAFAKQGVSVISGLAKGVDGIGQKAALSVGGNSYAVLGCGVDICYPEQNKEIYENLMKSGGVLSEYAIGTRPMPNLFPARNRIISGLSDGVLVIEAKEKSGTFITVDMALEQGKEVYALPGRINDSLSAGCNNLIRQGAIPAWSPQVVLEEFFEKEEIHKQYEEGERNIPKFHFDTISERKIYNILDITPKSTSQILQEMRMQKSNFEVSELMNVLLSLLLKGAAFQVGQNYYAKQL